MGRNLSFPLGSLVGICLALVMTQLFDDDCRSRKNFEQFSGSPVPAKSWRRQVEEADFNPVIEIGKRKESLSEELYQLRKSQVKRPRFYSTELEIKYGVYAGMLTTEHSYSSLGTSLNMSLAENVDRIEFFVNSKLGADEPSVRSFVKLSDDNQVPLLMKLVKYITTERSLSQTFSHFLFMSDNTYVNIHHLKQSILLMEISRPVLIIADNQKCNDINQAVSPALLFNSKFLDKCSDNITCWRVSCQETELSYSLYALNYDINGELAIDAREFSSALVTYPIYTTKLNLKLHQLASQNDLLNGLAKLHETEAELYKLVTDSSKFERNILQSTWPLGIPRPYKPTNRFSVIRWTEVNVQQKTSYLADDNQQIKILDEDDEEDIYRTISLIKLYCLKQNLINCDLMKIENFYKRFEAMRGLEYIVDIQIGENLNKRFEVLHPLNGIELVKGVPFVTELTSVLIVLPVRESDIISASSFMTHYAHTFLKRPNHSTKLVVLTLSTQALSNSTEHDAFSSLKITVNMLARRYAATANISVISVQSSLGHISQLAYLDLTVGQVMANDTLILHVQPAAQISFDFLNRVRMNTISGRQVFFPVPFVEYQIASENEESREMPLLVATSKGYFDDRTFNYFSFYSHDYLKIRQEYGPNFVSHEAEIIAEHIVSSSAWDAAKLFVESVQSRINILRITEPGLTERFFKKSSNCQSSESGTKAIAACLHRMQHSIGLKSQLAKSISDQA